MPRLIVLASPFSARRFFCAIKSEINDSLLINVGQWSFHAYPETKSIVQQVEEDSHRKRLMKGQESFSVFRQIRRFLLGIQYNGWRRLFHHNADAVAMCWNGTDGRRRLFVEAAKRSGVKVLFLEHSPIPEHLTCDPIGLNANNSLPRNADFYLEWMKEADRSSSTSPSSSENKKWTHFRQKIVPRKAHRKSSVYQSGFNGSIPQNKFVFCPLQVPNDSQVLEHGDWINGLPHMIEAIYQASRNLPDNWSLLIKEHPSAKVGFSHLILSREDERFKLVNNLPTFELVEASRGVLTLNSSVGLEAFFYSRPVLVLGHAFYDFHPVAIKVSDQNHLNSLFSNPEIWTFDPKIRDVFLKYLIEEYYLPFNLNERQCLSPKTVVKLKNLLSV